MNIKYLTPFFIIVYFSFCLASCKQKSGNHRTVSVSILPQKYFVERIAGDYLQINVMIPPGMNPATADLSTDQLKKLYVSDLCFTIGYLPFELTHLYPVLENRKDIKVINHSEGLHLLNGSCRHQHHGDHKHGSIDPHIWLSPANARQMATTIFQILSEHYPEQKESFHIHYQALLQDIDTVAQKAQQVFSTPQERVFLIYHPALTYFAADYGLEQISIEDEGKEPNPAHLKQLIDLAREKNIHIIFIQSQFDVDNAKSIAKEINGQIIPIDPLTEDWTGEMMKLIKVFETVEQSNH